MISRRILAAGVAASVAVTAMAGCTATPIDASTGSFTQSSSSVTASEFVAATSHLDANAVYVKSTSELAEVSELILSGHVVSVQSGPSYALKESPQYPSYSVYVEVRPESVLQGDYPAGENVWILINYLGPSDPAEYERSLAPGTRVVAYLNELDISNGLISEDSWWELTEESDPAAPGNGRLWMVSSTQGLVFDFGGVENLAWVLLGSVGSGELTDALPGGDVIGFPSDHAQPGEANE